MHHCMVGVPYLALGGKASATSICGCELSGAELTRPVPRIAGKAGMLTAGHLSVGRPVAATMALWSASFAMEASLGTKSTILADVLHNEWRCGRPAVAQKHRCRRCVQTVHVRLDYLIVGKLEVQDRLVDRGECASTLTLPFGLGVVGADIEIGASWEGQLQR